MAWVEVHFADMMQNVGDSVCVLDNGESLAIDPPLCNREPVSN